MDEPRSEGKITMLFKWILSSPMPAAAAAGMSMLCLAACENQSQSLKMDLDAGQSSKLRAKE
jgi:hypothetical protein